MHAIPAQETFFEKENTPRDLPHKTTRTEEISFLDLVIRDFALVLKPMRAWQA
jgi:hypothetical protein